MTINLSVPDIRELKPRITVFGVGGAGGNAVNNMIEIGLQGCEFVVGNTDAQALLISKAHRVIQMGIQVTEGLGAGSQPEVGEAAAVEVIDEIRDQLSGAHMVFVTAGMGGGTGTGAAPVVARAARDMGILTVGVVTKPFQFEGTRRMRLAEQGIIELQKSVDTLIVIPNQNLFRVANEQTTFADAFAMADRVLYSGVACITDLMVKEGLINLDFADVRAVMREMGKAMMGTGEATGEKRALRAAEAAISNPLLDDVNMRGARGLLISITGGSDLTLYEVDEAATRIREEVDPEANVIFGATRDDTLEGIVRVSVVATGIDHEAMMQEVAALETAHRDDLMVPMPDMSGLQPHAAASVRPIVRPEPVREEMAGPQARPLPQGFQPRSLQIGDDLAIRQMPPRQPAPELRPAVQQTAHEPADYVDQGGFIPPQSEKPVRPLRMPSVDELPHVAQLKIDSRSAERATAVPVEKRRQSLMEKLTLAGFGRRQDDGQAIPQPRPVAAHPEPRPVSEGDYGRRQQPAAQPRMFEEDHLEIPAFLRRQGS